MTMDLSTYSDLDDDCKKECDDLCSGYTVDQIEQMGQYLTSKASDMKRQLSSSVTIEDFQKMKKNGSVEDEGSEM